MRNTIWKYRLYLEDITILEVPYNSRIISCGYDPTGELCIWAEVDSNCERKVIIEARIYGTGFKLPNDPGRFIGTVMNGSFMWHIYVKGEK